jgi:rRNA maturation protein Nop10
MKDLDEHGRMCEESFGLISGMLLYTLHEYCTAAGSKWDMSDPSTMEIPVTKYNAVDIYSICKEIRSGYSIGLDKAGMNKIKKARSDAHKFLYEEANDPDTPIERKIMLVRLTSK